MRLVVAAGELEKSTGLTGHGHNLAVKLDNMFSSTESSVKSHNFTVKIGQTCASPTNIIPI
jgi:hypothetical protein